MSDSIPSTRHSRPAFGRRRLMQGSALAAAVAQTGLAQAAPPDPDAARDALTGSFSIVINGAPHQMTVDTRVTLLDLLRERLMFTGTKKGCDHGQCGACTVLVNGRRVLSCLSLAVMHDGDHVTTVEGLAEGHGPDAKLHPMQAAFLEHDGFQCGYCTPGQICSAVGMLDEWRNGAPSLVTDDLSAHPELSPAELHERMSGNICRCSAYPNIAEAILAVSREGA
jgi:xanthine dehydrogenase YagT iron-sulfur-binding subunit